MAKKFQIVKNFVGYRTKPDPTNTSIRALVFGSQNVIVNDGEKIASRAGYAVDGQTNTALNPIESSFDWVTSSDLTRHLRSYDDELEYRFVASDSTITWRKLADGWANVDFVFAPWWDTSEGIDILLFVNGDANIYDWSGLVTTIASVTSNTLTKQGTNTWAQDRALTAGTRQVIINGVTYTYTGGETTSALTGVTPDPTAQGGNTPVAGDICHQAIRTSSNQPASGSNNDGIAVLDNQVYIGSRTSREISISKNSSFTDYTFSSPRVSGEGGLLTLDNSWRAFAPDADSGVMNISAGDDDWYRVEFEQITVSTTLAETVNVKKLKTGSGQAAQSQDLVANAKNAVIFISNEPTLDELGRVENIPTEQQKPLSDPIKPDFDNANFTNGHIKYHKRNIFICDPNNDKVYIYDIEKGYWQTPQILPIRRFSIIDGDLYGHSSSIPETYKLFTGTGDRTDFDNSDTGKPFKVVARFAYRNFGDRPNLKSFDEWFVEGYISANTELTHRLLFDFDGATGSVEKIINGSDPDLVEEPVDGFSLGLQSLGNTSLAGDIGEETIPKFRFIHTISRIDFHEVQEIFETNDNDQVFQILATGPEAILSKAQPTSIKK